MTLKELEKSVRTMEDILEIENMHREFVFWINHRQFEEWLNKEEFEEIINCFAENVTAEIGPYGVKKGKDEVSRLFNELVSKGELPGARYIVSQPIITVEGDTAKGCWVSYRFVGTPTTPPSAIKIVSWEQGRHDCEYVREDGKWKFLKMKWTIPWPQS